MSDPSISPEQSIRLAAAGDAIVTRRLRQFKDEPFRDLVETVRSADAAMVNLEVLLHDYEGYPSPNAGGTYMRAPPAVADELAWLGFDLYAAATNHAMDYLHGGMLRTMEVLEERELAYAGLGRHRAAAREPAYVDTPAGRVALVACCSTVVTGSEAGVQTADLHGRPGISKLGLETRYRLPSEELDRLQTMSERLGLEATKERQAKLGFPVTDDDAPFELLNVAGENIAFEEGDEYAVARRATPNDVQAITDEIQLATRQADWVIASLHAHEGEGPKKTDRTVPKFMKTFARKCVDAGADAFVGHGPHLLRGIDLYEEAPIFYSLGNFALQNETVTRLPPDIYERYDLDPNENTVADVYDARLKDEDGSPSGFLSDSGFWESILPVWEFENGKLAGIELHPITLLGDRPRPQRGRPIRARGETAQEILTSLQELSEPFDTDIVIDGDTGSITL